MFFAPEGTRPRRTGPRITLAVAAAFVTLFAARELLADLDGSYVLPQDHPAIGYSKNPATDRVALLQQALQQGKAKLDYDSEHGYLPAILQALGVPISSQVLVFSKTSFQAPRISPTNPRALYYNDDVSIGWVRGGDVVEIAAVDPQLGVAFYTLDQEKVAKPRIERRGECLQCHASGGTLGVPGLVVRSIYPERSGMPLFHAGGFVTDHRSPLKERWGGWYVTGTHGDQQHMGNIFVENVDKPDQLDRARGANLTDLKYRFDTGAWLSPHSDIVSLMVLEHQTRMTNLIVRVGWETRMAIHEQRSLNQALGNPLDELSESARHRIDNASEVLVKYMLFGEETVLTAPIHGSSDFAREFAARGPKDKQGRSLREFDLTHRMFRYPCSYMIYSQAFDALPEAAKSRIYRRLWEILTAPDPATLAQRTAIREILRDTKPMPDYWKPAALAEHPKVDGGNY